MAARQNEIQMAQMKVRHDLSALPALTMPPGVVSNIVEALEAESRRTERELIDLTTPEVHLDELVEAEYRGKRRRRRSA